MKALKLVFSRSQLYFIGLAILSFYYLLNKIDFIIHGSTAKGTVVGYEMLGNMNCARVEFFANKSYYFSAASNVAYIRGEKIDVIYSNSNPANAYIFSFLGFWYEGLIICIVPLVLWSSFVFSFFSKSDKIILLEKHRLESQDSKGKEKLIE